MINYKKIVKSRKLRLAILRFFSFIPDKWMIKFQYRMKMGRKLNIKNPKRYNEKLQWYKLNYRNPLMIKCVDKYDVREYVDSLGLGHILTKCYGVFDKSEDVNFTVLPEKFVIKDTLGSGGNSVIICRDKAALDVADVQRQMTEWVNTTNKVKSGGREWPYYSGKKHRIIIEEFIESDENEGGLVDYKFFCFNGKAEYMFVLAERTLGDTASLDIYDADFNKLPYRRSGKKAISYDFKRPENFEELRKAAEKLSEDFPHVRVDMYDQNGKIVFGELTFFSGSGYSTYEPDEFEYLMGEKFVLPERNK